MATGLLNITLATEEVAGVTVKGISARGVAYLMTCFPEIRMLMTGKDVNLSVDRITMLAPSAIAAIIACGCGHVPNGTPEGAKEQEAAEAKAAEIPVGMQADFIEPILRLTMPGGVGPFVAKLEKLGDFASDAFGPGAGTKSGPQSPNSATPALSATPPKDGT